MPAKGREMAKTRVDACGRWEKMRPASPRLAATVAVLLLRSGLESRGSKHGSVISVERLVRKCRCRGVNRKLKLRRSAQESAYAKGR